MNLKLPRLGTFPNEMKKYRDLFTNQAVAKVLVQAWIIQEIS